MAVLGHQIGKALVDALGLPKGTVGFTLRCYHGELVSVECEYFPDPARGLATELAAYELVRKMCTDLRDTLTLPVAVDFDAWMRAKTDAAHAAYMERTAALSCIHGG